MSPAPVTDPAPQDGDHLWECFVSWTVPVTLLCVRIIDQLWLFSALEALNSQGTEILRLEVSSSALGGSYRRISYLMLLHCCFALAFRQTEQYFLPFGLFGSSFSTTSLIFAKGSRPTVPPPQPCPLEQRDVPGQEWWARGEQSVWVVINTLQRELPACKWKHTGCLGCKSIPI